MAAKTRQPFYRSKVWQQCREATLMRDCYLCVLCGAPASDVHHIIHLNDSNVNDPSVALNPDNLVSLCKACHNRVHAIPETPEGYAFDGKGYLVKLVSPRSKSGK